MALPRISPAACIILTTVFLEQMKFNESRPASVNVTSDDHNHQWSMYEGALPTYVRPIRLYSKQGHYVAILTNGTVTATRNETSEDGKPIFFLQYRISKLFLYSSICHFFIISFEKTFLQTCMSESSPDF